MARAQINMTAVFRVLSDVLIIGTGGVVLLLFKLVVDPYKRGFFCDDQSLQHPFISSTVTSTMLYGIGFSLALFLIMSIETYWVIKKKGDFVTRDGCAQSKLTVIIQNIYLSLAPFFYGATTEHVILDIAKYSIGRLRPHFFDVCNINVTELDCSSGYIEDFECKTDDAYKLHELRLSFPSGHASYSSYVAVYLMIYLQYRMTFWSSTLFRPVLQMLLFSMTWYTCLSRNSNYKHHPTDVLGGFIIGVTVAILVATKVARMKVEEENEKAVSHRDDRSLPDQNETLLQYRSVQDV